LLHYRALRSRDLRSLQKKLGYMGLSRLAQSQSHVMASLQTNRSILQAILDKAPLQMPDNELSFKKGEKALKSNAKKLLGYRTKSRRTRIMVTMPTAAADDYEMVSEMLKAGMNCARINCAHDNPDTWEKINANVRRAAMELGKKCKVAMDLAGPKIRTGPIAEGPRVMKIKPPKNISGKIKKPLDIWLGTALKPGFLHVPISQKSINILEGDETLFFRDASGKKRSFNLLEKQEGGFVAQCKKTTFIYEGMPLFTNKEMDGTPVEIGGIAPVQMPILLKPGDLLRLDKEPLLGEAAVYGTEGEVLAKAHISCTEPIIFDQVKPGERILFDDGKIEGIIKKTDGESILVEVTHIPKGTAKLRAEKGINFPDSQLTISGLTEKDKKDLPFIAAHADVVNFSFVNRPEDVRELLEELEKIGAKDKLGIILKIETQDGYNHLTEILLEAMQTSPVGVMIARGDLAVETGWDNIGRIQEEILSLCEAAHVTDIWATQVLENLAKKGIPSRSEITDATMAQRADCVMLNKGPYILEAIRLLDNILSDMEFYWEKNMPLSPMMDGQIKAQL
ncbi:MAG TPA: hypothetical protein ENJ95_10835, partial [Bacteroidetes bacterium]|nr:hypothetical protein [Bacteroidota bacterium]